MGIPGQFVSGASPTDGKAVPQPASSGPELLGV